MCRLGAALAEHRFLSVAPRKHVAGGTGESLGAQEPLWRAPVVACSEPMTKADHITLAAMTADTMTAFSQIVRRRDRFR